MAAVSSSDFEFAVTQSVFDRLLDLEPGSVRDSPSSRVEGVERLKRSVCRDLEQLLNTRNPFADLHPEFVEAGQSVLTYGLADFSQFNFVNPVDQDRVRQIIERSIRLFEPRLTAVVVTILPMVSTDRALRLHLEARLLLDPEPVPVSFDILMPQQNASRYEVKEKA